MLAKVSRWLGAAALGLSCASTAFACPFCEATSPTWSQSIADSSAAVIAQVKKVETPNSDEVVVTLQARYAITHLLHGPERLGDRRALEIETLEEPSTNAHYLMTAVGSPDLSWSTLVELNALRGNYLAAARKLPAQGVNRWQFFYQYLEHADEELAADAYGEFAAASFAEVKAFAETPAFAERANRAQLWRWIESDKTPESRRGLYYTLLGVCGQQADMIKLASMLREPEKRPPGAFSALIACYISVRGEAGLRDVERQFLQTDVSEADAQAVVAALRFHGEEQHVLKRERVAQAMRLLLERKDVAGSVIPDLARWQDWECLPRIVRLFKESQGDDAWVRIPVVAYLKVCPLEEAQQRLAELKTIDPQAVEQAEALSLFGAQLRPTTDKTYER